ncbi:4552_t:CDS:2, partial [Dentiscutata erythropus]
YALLRANFNIEEWQYAITICSKVPGQCIKTITNWVWESARDNSTLLAYLQVGQEVCQHYYNGLMQSSVVIKEHAKATSNIQQLNANTLDLEANTRHPSSRKYIKTNEDDNNNIIIIGSNEDTELDSLLQKLKEL